MTLYLCNITHLKQEIFPKAMEFLPPERQKKALSYVFEGDRQRSVGAGLLLEFWRRAQKIPLDAFTQSDSGKPQLSPQIPLSFNLSHSGDFVLFAGDSQQIGVDIEKIAPNFLDVAENYFTKAEQEQIFASSDLDKQEKTFFRLWTLKESYMKATGLGFSLPLHSFSVELGEKQPVFAPSHPLYPDFSLAECQVPSGYQASVCVLGKQWKQLPLTPKEITVAEILETFQSARTCDV